MFSQRQLYESVSVIPLKWIKQLTPVAYTFVED